jgi:hypothetical protein
MLVQNKMIRFALLVLIPFIWIKCQSPQNPVLNYLTNAELQYEGAAQKENIANAMHDILSLSEEGLKARKYMDYTGKDNQWDLPTLITRHFVPDKQGKTLGNNFYHDIQLKETKEIVSHILERINSSQ